MRKEKREQTCKEIIDYLIDEGFKIQVTKKDLSKAIRVHVGFDPRTVKNWIQLLEDLGYIERVIASFYSTVWKINPLRVQLVFNKLKEKPQSRLQ